jgi:hypothetical protein
MKNEKPVNYVLHAFRNDNEQKATFYLGKCALYRNGKRNAVEITIELHNRNGKPEFTAHGDVWNQNHSDICRGGQCLDDPIFVNRAKRNPLLAELLRFWNLYHLNGMNPGTEAQEAAVKEMPEDWMPEEGEKVDGITVRDKWDHYGRSCVWLQKRGLYEVPDPRDPSKPYRYGAAWLYREIPAADLARIREIIANACTEYQSR